MTLNSASAPRTRIMVLQFAVTLAGAGWELVNQGMTGEGAAFFPGGFPLSAEGFASRRTPSGSTGLLGEVTMDDMIDTTARDDRAEDYTRRLIFHGALSRTDRG